MFDSQGTELSLTVDLDTPSSNLNLVGLGFRNYKSSYSYGAVYATVSTVTLLNCSFWDNSFGVSVFLSSARLDNVSFNGGGSAVVFGYSDYGGQSSNVVATNVVVSGANIGVDVRTGSTVFRGTNVAMTGVSMGLYASSSQPYDVSFESSSFVGSGTAVFANAQGGSSQIIGKVRLLDSVVSNCSSATNGAGVSASANVAVAIGNSVFEGNVAQGKGGAFYCDNKGSVTIQDSVVKGNTANDGGAGWCAKYCAFVSSNVTVVDNNQKQDTGICAGLGQ